MEFEFLADGIAKKVAVEREKRPFHDPTGRSEVRSRRRRISDNELVLVVDGRSYDVLIARDKDRKILFMGGREYVFREPGEEAGRSWTDDHKGPGGGLKIKAPMPGKVIKVSSPKGRRSGRTKR